jgi:CHAT domain-containing protein/tetratricopeptide (TPR) repeat protein
MNKLKRWTVTALTTCCLLLGLSYAAATQNREAQVAEASRLAQQASQLHRAGRYAEATPLAERALLILEKVLGQEHPNYTVWLNMLAMLYQDQGDYGRAEPLLLRALAIQEKVLGPEHPNFAVSLNNLALLYKAKHDYGRAEPLFLRSLEIREKVLGADHPQVATALNNLAGLYKDQGGFKRAAPLYQRTLKILEKVSGPEHPNFATTLNNLALLYSIEGDYKQAEPLYQRALAIREKVLGPEHPYVATSLNNLAMLYKNQGKYELAVGLFHRALMIKERVLGTQHLDFAGSLYNLGLLYYAQGAYGRTVGTFEQSCEIYEKNLALILSTGSQHQKQLYLNRLSGGTDIIVSLHTQYLPQNTDAARLALTEILRRKGRDLDAVTDQIAVLRNRATPEDQKLLAQLATLQSRLAAQQLSSADQLSPEDLKVQETRIDLERLEDAISRSSAEFRASIQPLTLAMTLGAVRQAMPDDTALIEFFVYTLFNAKAKTETGRFGPPRYVAYVLRRAEEAPQFVDLGEAALLNDEVERLRVALKDSKHTDVQAIARIVDERVMRPIRRLLGQTRHIFLSPDGALNLIPFAALVDENGKYLVENYSLTYLTSGRDLLRLQARAKSYGAPMVLANPLYDMPATQHAKQPATQNDESRHVLDFTVQNYKPLPGTAEEAAVLGKLLPDVRVLMQGDATENALKQVHGPRILHIATHGFFLSNQPRDLPESSALRRVIDDMALSPGPLPQSEGWEGPLLRSGLILAGVRQQQSGTGEDGVLTALETVGLDLWGTELVVLSACETGVGDVQNGEGVYGLRRALVLAGSQTQVMSLWKVSDAGTRDLMSAYYTRLQAGEERTEALRQVQLAMQRGELKPTQDAANYQHPYYWAAFILSGDWRSMDIAEPTSRRTTILFVVIGVIIVLFALLLRLRRVI